MNENEIVEWRSAVWALVRWGPPHPKTGARTLVEATHPLFLWWDTLEQAGQDMTEGRKCHSYFRGVRI